MNLGKIKTTLNSFLETKIIPLSGKKKAGIFAAAGLLPIVAFVILFYSPHHKEILALEKNQRALENELIKVKARAQELDKQKMELAETERLYQEASVLLPEKKEIPSLLTNISSLGTNAGLDFLSFQPRGESIKDFYAEIPIDIAVRGPYHNVGTFLDQVSKLDRIVTVANISMGSPAQESGEVLLSTKFNLVTYRFIEPKEEVQKKPKTDAKKKR